MTLAVAGVLSGFFDWMPDHYRITLIVAAMMAAVLRDSSVLTFPMPERKRLVAQEVTKQTAFLASFQFGFEMGTGWRTYLTSSLPYVLIVAFMLGEPSGALVVIVAAGFGLGRLGSLVALVSWGGDWVPTTTTKKGLLALAGTAVLLVGVLR